MFTEYKSFTEVPIEKVNEVFVCPTDTVYGLSTSVLETASIEKIRKMKGKDPSMPLIVIIGSFEQIAMFTPDNSVSVSRLAEKLWPGPVSIIFPNIYEKWNSLSPNGSLAIRMPEVKELRDFLCRVGPLVSTSANKTGHTPCTSFDDVVKIFPDLSFGINTGDCDNPPSTLIKVLR